MTPPLSRANATIDDRLSASSSSSFDDALAPTRNSARLYKSKRSDASELDLSGYGQDYSEGRPTRIAYVVTGLALALLVLTTSADRALVTSSRQLQGADSQIQAAASSAAPKQLRGAAPPPKETDHYLDLIHDHGDCSAKIWCGAEVFTKPAELCAAAPSFPGAPELDDACETSRCTWSDGCKTYADFFCFNKIAVRKGTWREVCAAADKAVEAYSDAAARADTIAESERLAGFADQVKLASETHCLADGKEMDAKLLKVLKDAVHEQDLTAAPKLSRLKTLSRPKTPKAH